MLSVEKFSECANNIWCRFIDAQCPPLYSRNAGSESVKKCIQVRQFQSKMKILRINIERIYDMNKSNKVPPILLMRFDSYSWNLCPDFSNSNSQKCVASIAYNIGVSLQIYSNVVFIFLKIY